MLPNDGVPGVKETPRRTLPEAADSTVRKASRAGNEVDLRLSVMLTSLSGSAPWSPLPLTVEVTAHSVTLPSGLTRPVRLRSPSVAGAQGSPVPPGPLLRPVGYPRTV